MWLQFGGLTGGQFGHGHPVGPGPFGHPVEPGPLGLVGGHHQFPAPVVDNSTLGAEVGHPFAALDGQSGLQRTRLVVDACVEDPAVVAGLMGGQRRLLVEYHYQRAGQPGGERPGSGKADDPPADHHHVDPGAAHGSTLPVPGSGVGGSQRAVRASSGSVTSRPKVLATAGSQIRPAHTFRPASRCGSASRAAFTPRSARADT